MSATVATAESSAADVSANAAAADDDDDDASACLIAVSFFCEEDGWHQHQLALSASEAASSRHPSNLSDASRMGGSLDAGAELGISKCCLPLGVCDYVLRNEQVRTIDRAIHGDYAN